MQTQVKTRDMLKLLNPQKDGVYYEDHHISVDFNELNSYIQNPGKMKVFETSADLKEKLYRNLALYIINAQPKTCAVAINLDKDNIIEQGLFHYLNVVYRKEELLHIELPEEGNNALFIKSKKLTEVAHRQPLAVDEHLGTLQNPFVQATAQAVTQDASGNQEVQNVVANGRFSWQHDSSDLYANEEYVLTNLAKLLKYDSSRRHEDTTREFGEFIDKVNTDLLKKEDFQLKLLDISSHYLYDWILGEKGRSLLGLDIGKDSFQEKMFHKIKNKEFYLLEKIFESYQTELGYVNYRHYNKQPHEAIKPPVDFYRLLNEPETVKHLVEKYHYESRSDKGLSIVNAYPFFNEQNKEDEKVLSKYISCIKSKTMHGSTYINETALYKLPIHLFNRPEILREVLPYMEIESFEQELKKQNATNALLSDKQFLLANAHNIPDHIIRKIITTFHDKQSIDKQYVMDMIAVKPDMIDQFFGSDEGSSSRYGVTRSCVNIEPDLDIVMHAYQSGLRLNKISLMFLKPFLLETDSDPKKENFKFQYLISNNLVGSSGNYVYDEPEDIKAFQAKYNLVEYLFFKRDRSHYGVQGREKLAAKIKTLEALNDFFDRVDALKRNYDFDAHAFYKALPVKMQNDLAVLMKVSSYGDIPYQDLGETLQYNKAVALKFMKQNGDNIPYVPVHFFNDMDFALEFAKIIDQNGLNDKTPLFITKFFENQGVTENYHEYLKSYMEASSLKEALPLNPQNPSVKKRKI